MAQCNILSNCGNVRYDPWHFRSRSCVTIWAVAYSYLFTQQVFFFPFTPHPFWKRYILSRRECFGTSEGLVVYVVVDYPASASRPKVLAADNWELFSLEPTLEEASCLNQSCSLSIGGFLHPIISWLENKKAWLCCSNLGQFTKTS